MAFDESVAHRVRGILGQPDTVSERRMFGGLAFMIEGHMALGIVGRDLVVRVGGSGYEAALAQPHARPMDFTGRPMKGFVYVGPAGYDTDARLRAWIQRGLRFASSLPPK